MNFTNSLLGWYHKNKRSLPWRETLDPYKIWVSEIILQQTRVDQGLPYYYRFLEAFPDVATLAASDEQQVLNVWSGLGYYSRARNMHLAARMVMDEMGGIFPKDCASLLKLKGIGHYTAAAVSSICNNESIPVIDGNVIRVFSRYFGISEPVGSISLLKKIKWASDQLIPTKDPGNYNQSIMEYGALVCTPTNPDCQSCVLRMSCYAYLKDEISLLPVRKKSKIKRSRFFNYIHLLNNEGKIVLKQRTGEDIWKRLWDFPLVESSELMEFQEVVSKFNLLGYEFISQTDTDHILTHQILHIRIFSLRISGSNIDMLPGWQWVDYERSEFPVPKVIKNFLELIK